MFLLDGLLYIVGVYKMGDFITEYLPSDVYTFLISNLGQVVAVGILAAFGAWMVGYLVFAMLRLLKG